MCPDLLQPLPRAQEEVPAEDGEDRDDQADPDRQARSVGTCRAVVDADRLATAGRGVVLIGHVDSLAGKGEWAAPASGAAVVLYDLSSTCLRGDASGRRCRMLSGSAFRR